MYFIIMIWYTTRNDILYLSYNATHLRTRRVAPRANILSLLIDYVYISFEREKMSFSIATVAAAGIRLRGNLRRITENPNVAHI